MRIAIRLVALLLSAHVTGLACGLTLAAPRCTKTCRRETAACKQTQCAGLAGEQRRACVRTCDERSNCTAPGARIGTLAYVVHECQTDAQGFHDGSPDADGPSRRLRPRDGLRTRLPS